MYFNLLEAYCAQSETDSGASGNDNSLKVTAVVSKLLEMAKAAAEVTVNEGEFSGDESGAENEAQTDQDMYMEVQDGITPETVDEVVSVGYQYVVNELSQGRGAQEEAGLITLLTLLDQHRSVSHVDIVNCIHGLKLVTQQADEPLIEFLTNESIDVGVRIDVCEASISQAMDTGASYTAQWQLRSHLDRLLRDSLAKDTSALQKSSTKLPTSTGTNTTGVAADPQETHVLRIAKTLQRAENDKLRHVIAHHLLSLQTDHMTTSPENSPTLTITPKTVDVLQRNWQTLARNAAALAQNSVSLQETIELRITRQLLKDQAQQLLEEAQ
ncbi:hypothetical protein Kpol_1037p1 [Vanderwaltozyma polyspora DSM 70294]|uniref:Uncharacterized protein n=1 Tax=Vanderwaltozyma polyspora (strain ATCC 22028 / DSM 70294 / BCRC 21397 / CBS 2163 / NBRC 10782 / NRRL Y-8283 / UCD 57-17) TaxID=436907 RepID=A7TJU3_VANPO|nr:uncharacterized protein Kpol_1037p1 [Vanderwaltozyma polyspora DSM 70294]EDO17405.1 hypothetical protein Kpol_1037p1 [Vanderwaltozyma polyspora DSM 70294]